MNNKLSKLHATMTTHASTCPNCGKTLQTIGKEIKIVLPEESRVDLGAHWGDKVSVTFSIEEMGNVYIKAWCKECGRVFATKWLQFSLAEGKNKDKKTHLLKDSVARKLRVMYNTASYNYSYWCAEVREAKNTGYDHSRHINFWRGYKYALLEVAKKLKIEIPNKQE